VRGRRAGSATGKSEFWKSVDPWQPAGEATAKAVKARPTTISPGSWKSSWKAPTTSVGHGFGSSRRTSATVAVRYLMLENAPRAAESIHAVQFNLGSGAQRTLRQVLSG